METFLIFVFYDEFIFHVNVFVRDGRMRVWPYRHTKFDISGSYCSYFQGEANFKIFSKIFKIASFQRRLQSRNRRVGRCAPKSQRKRRLP